MMKTIRLWTCFNWNYEGKKTRTKNAYWFLTQSYPKKREILMNNAHTYTYKAHNEQKLTQTNKKIVRVLSKLSFCLIITIITFILSRAASELFFSNELSAVFNFLGRLLRFCFCVSHAQASKQHFCRFWYLILRSQFYIYLFICLSCNAKIVWVCAGQGGGISRYKASHDE